MDDQITLGILAIVLGTLVGVVLFVPFVAISYRRRGGLSLGRSLLWAAALVYFLAIWTYTLLPLPDPDAIRCVGTNLDPLALVDDVRTAVGRSDNPWFDPLALQLLLNVLLFVPLGFFLRVLGGRGILTALLVGLGLSAFIETTQLTGVWGLYPCAYRVFDVDDMLTNTTGAVVGSILSLVVPRRHRGMAQAPDADQPRPVTRGRRVIAMLCDVLGIILAISVVGTATQLWLQFVVGDRQAVLDGGIADAVSTVVPPLAWLVVILVTGRSIGDLAVQLRYRGGPLPAPLARVLRWAGGVSGWVLLGYLPGWGQLGALLFAAVSIVLVFTTARGRGLPGILSGMRLEDAREGGAVPGEGVSPARPGTPAPPRRGSRHPD
ncbi:VanZ family protein [Microbacterium aurantiacum]|uniref:VanZ family protein n=1 Tax=Microbacterium aurantiacum TaxID=162393 RepID=A0AAJ2LV17_9MICO|nr:VanZ family protein [Microbacterium aurantiacum]MDS0244735.1 VanZ family protein [Microbacterium aurantiacum]